MCHSSFAQNQNNQWRFGYGGGVNFNTNPPSFVPGAPIATQEGSASIADKTTGALLFYTDGVTVWNASNQIMPNGTGLLGGRATLLSSTTAAVIVPKPGSSNLFYIVTVDELGSNNGVRYSVVDMTLNGGTGGIVAGEKNIFLYQSDYEKLEVVPASDGLSYWLITYSDNSEFVSFKIGNTGIQTTPVISAGVQSFGAGHMKINRQFNKLAIGGFNYDMALYEFNNATGVVSNPVIWNFNLSSPLIYGIEFSPDGKVLYISDLATLLQYDITQTTSQAIQNSVYQVATGGNTSLQLGIDNKIYVNAGSLNVINCPNKLGAACGYQTNVIAGGGGYGLPKWVYYTNDIPTKNSNAIIYSDSCFGNATQFSIQNTAGISSVTWNFNDPITGANDTTVGFTSSHTFSQVGNYIIRAFLSNACGTDTLYLSALSIVDCNNTSPTITGIKLIGDTCTVPSSLALQSQGASSSNYFFWNFGDPASGINDTITITGLSPSPFPTHTFSSAGVYNVCISFQEPGFPVSKVCRKISIGLCCNGIISSKDTCLENSIPFSILSGATISSVTWNFDDPSSGANNTSTLLTPRHLFSKAGIYKIRAIVNFNCGADTIFKTITVINCDSIVGDCQLLVPTAFTPNGDGINDKFYPSSICTFENYKCLIFNRWGQLIYTTSNQTEKWDGKYKGSDCPVGAYVYLITYRFPAQQTKDVYGTITLLR